MQTITNLESIIFPLRLQLGDVSDTPKYSDDMLLETLKHSVNALSDKWSGKYFIDNNGVVHRNSQTSEEFEFPSPPVIMLSDHRAIVLMASIMVKSGQRFSASNDVSSWKDDEISFSNIEGSKQLTQSLTDDIKELMSILPARKLARPLYGRLRGQYKDWVPWGWQ
jgi:hypothetical protein